MVIAVGWQVYRLTGRVLDLGLIGLSQFLPFLCLALFAGHAADVHDRRVIIMRASPRSWSARCSCSASRASRSRACGPSSACWHCSAWRAPSCRRRRSLSCPTSFRSPSLGNAIAINSSAFKWRPSPGPASAASSTLFGESSHAPNGGAQWVFGTAAALLAIGVGLSVAAQAPQDQPWHPRGFLGPICSRDCGSSGGAKRYWVPYRSICLRYCSAAPRRSCRPSPRTSCTRAREVFGYLRAAPGVGAVLMALWLDRAGRYGGASGFLCSAASPYLGYAPSFSG